MNTQVQMCYGLGTVKVAGQLVAVTLKTRVTEYAKKQSFAYLAWKHIQAENRDLIRISPGRVAGCHVVTAVATGDNMSRLCRLVNEVQIMNLEAQLCLKKGQPLPEWVTGDRPDKYDLSDDLPF